MQRILPLIAALLVGAACVDRPERAASTPGETAHASAIPTVAALSVRRVDTLRDTKGAAFVSTSTGVIALSNGGFAALDLHQSRVGRFDVSGALQNTVGGRGSGPGEFQRPMSIFSLPSDSLAVWDTSLLRLSVFDGALGFSHTVRLDRWSTLMSFGMQLVGRFADGRWVGLVTMHEPGNPDAPTGVRSSVDTLVLFAGGDGEAPSEFIRLPLRPVVEVVLTRGPSSTIRRLQMAAVSQGVGAVCERGMVLVDATGVRQLDPRGRTLVTYPSPRLGDSIRTRSQREAIVNEVLEADIASSVVASKARGLLKRNLGGATERVATATIDADGALWYLRGSRTQQPFVLERVDRQGRDDVAIELQVFAMGASIGRTGVAMNLPGSDTTDNVAVFAHFPVAAVISSDGPLGRCAAPFRY
ncbi:MAG: hypothetical protein ABMA00_21765 [Gemmatimonas sp.]